MCTSHVRGLYHESRRTFNLNPARKQAATFVSGEQMFEMEPQEAVDSLKICLKVCLTQYINGFRKSTPTQNR